MNAEPRRLVAVVAAAAILATGCGGDSAEDVLERLAEQESGEDVDIDFDDGEINVRTEDGEITVDVDDDGSFTIEGEDGQVFAGEGDVDDGEFTFEAGDEDVTFQASGEVPDGWPGAVPVPSEMEITAGSSTSSGDESFFTVVGQVDDGPAWFDAYTGSLESAGYTETTTFTQGDQSFSILEGSDHTVQVNVSEFGGRWEAAVTVGPAQS